ncbi:MAG TPA: ABC transporter permease [Anaerolineales bacterium]|nr:ABC transporter permease [Anaerolineales bacterium]
MLVYIVKRILMTLLVLLMVVVFLTLLVHIVPGDPVTMILGPRATPSLIAQMRSAMDLDKPIYVQIGHFLWNILHGSLGMDAVTGVPIATLIGSALPHTMILAVSSLLLAVLIGVPIGMYSATHTDSLPDRILTIGSISLTTIPSYVAGLFLLLIFAVELHALPAMGLGNAGDTLDYIKHLILPSIALAITWIGYLGRLVRTSLLEVFNETYVRASRAAGISERLIRYRYALKNALIPTVAILGVGLGSLMGGAVFIEIIFTRPGMGLLIYNAIQTRNYPLVRAGVFVVAVLFVLANLLADLVYTYLDPRIQLNKRMA